MRDPVSRFIKRLTKERAREGSVTASTAGVLWVDDRPEHNARLLNDLRGQGVAIDVVRTTDEALTRLAGRRYAIIVLDMSRVEDHDRVAEISRRLLDRVGDTTPVMIFSRYPSTLAGYPDGGAVAVVSSEAEIKDWLRAVRLLP